MSSVVSKAGNIIDPWKESIGSEDPFDVVVPPTKLGDMLIGLTCSTAGGVEKHTIGDALCIKLSCELKDGIQNPIKGPRF